mmetsp:Transcript_1073/g.1787  ORF Transcript_1073/g.1787 Transcript_1073/m.1787 type:complete len:232 (-) Transcript_1073:240-935(-)
MASLQLTDKNTTSNGKLIFKMRQFTLMASEIVGGLSPPYVNVSTRRLFKKFLAIILKHRNVFQSINIMIPREITSQAQSLHFELSGFFQKPTQRIQPDTRKNIIKLVEDISTLISNVITNHNEQIKVLSPKRIEAMSEIISEIIAERVQYSVEYFPDKKVIVYIGDVDLLESIESEISESMRKYNLSGTVEVVFASKGSVLSNCRLESKPFLVSGAPVKHYVPSEDGDFPP